MTIISTRWDLRNWIDDGALGDYATPQQVDAVTDAIVNAAVHPPYGTDWSIYLETRDFPAILFGCEDRGECVRA